MESNEPKTSIVSEVFQGNNYKRWSACMRNYLRGEGLWEVLNEGTRPEENDEKFKIWEKKDAKVLHLIQISCSLDILDQIVELHSAKDAWDHLASMEKEEKEEETEIKPFDIQPDLDLYKAIRSGDWEATMNLLESKGDDKFSSVISSNGETILHVATLSGQVMLVKKLVQEMKPSDLEITTIYGQTALSCAARLGNTKIARYMVMQNPNLVTISNQFCESRSGIPVVEAAFFGHKDMVKYLKSVTPEKYLESETSTDGVELLTSCIDFEFFDIALELLHKFPQLAVRKDVDDNTALMKLVVDPSTFKSGSELVFWQRLIYYSLPVRIPGTSNNSRRDIESGYEGPINRESMTQIALNRSHECVWEVLKLFVPLIKNIYEEKLKHMQVQKLLSCICEQMSSFTHSGLEHVSFLEVTTYAAMYGIVEFFIEAEKFYPDILSTKDQDNDRGIFSIATAERNNNILNLMFNSTTNTQKALNNLDSDGNNIFHCAAMLAPSAKLELISGAALQMQWELKWFKEVENLVKPSMRGFTNNDGKTPRTLFTEQHKKLKEDGEKWMKDNAASCGLVSALIATIMFAAAFTVPGGNDGSNGIPIFLHNMEFKVFIVSDALSLFSAATSLLMFLGILTSRYREEDFIVSLPTKLIIGLSTLFFSIVAMVISFGTTLVLMFQNRSAWFLTPIISIASIPVLAFAWMQFPLLLEIFYSTYILTFLQKPKKQHNNLPWLRNAASKFLSRRKVKP